MFRFLRQSENLQENLTKILALVFLIFGPWAQELFIFDMNIGFHVKNCIFSPPEMSRIPKLGSIGELGPFKMDLNDFRGLRGL